VPRLTWTIRPKGERDSGAITALLADVAREGRYIATEWPFDVDARERALREALLARTVLGWVATDGSTVVADLTVFEPDRDEPLLGMVVALTYRGRGIGRALIERVCEWARQNAKPALVLRVFPDNDAAIGLYRATGFEEIGFEPRSIPRRDGTARDAIVMRKALSARAGEVAGPSADEEDRTLSRVRRSPP
jgi:ribosomal protein S18 acetylase RimI-like enzyme